MGKRTFWSPSPLPATLTLPPSRPPSERNKKTPAQMCLRVLGTVGLGRREEFGEHSRPRKQEGESLPFQPPVSRRGDRWLLVQQAASSFLDRNL